MKIFTSYMYASQGYPPEERRSQKGPKLDYAQIYTEYSRAWKKGTVAWAKTVPAFPKLKTTNALVE